MSHRTVNLAAYAMDSWGALSQGVRGPGPKVDHSPQSSFKVKNEWSCTYISPYKLVRSNKMQQYAGIYLLQNHSTCFGCPSHPLSGLHKTVTAASGTGHSI